MHITAGVYINDAEDGLIADIEAWLEKLAPFRTDIKVAVHNVRWVMKGGEVMVGAAKPAP